MSSKPAIIISGGSWCPPALYSDLAQKFQANGYETHITDHRTNSAEKLQPLPSPDEDAALISELIEKHANAGKDVVLLMHSYGGLPGTTASKGLSKRDRQASGKPGGIVCLLYMASWILELGKTGLDSVPEGAYPRSTEYPVKHVIEDGWIRLEFEDSYETMWTELPPESAKILASQLIWCSGMAGATPLSWAGYRDIPVSFLVAEKDGLFALETQLFWIERLKALCKHEVSVYLFQAGHMLMNEGPEILDGILKAVEESVDKARG
ncbi:Alpha/Beta hydrolase protein [Xylariales sp. PMI_506]|nr:Alpha/Beta hydrolase protein [Xylariales sp. PMI_506]